ncbi:Protein of unknown function [Pyronema omphalodes CBS 100304]|uniref:Uncharacterized protein n=1 Tax=Pyronema omphalodes (strain CBS 100304) TaxID=1076935 RepID=U4LC85_PYROM|nr:Protein of unknown function [Pyronema omphalodes CBS 100304]
MLACFCFCFRPGISKLKQLEQVLTSGRLCVRSLLICMMAAHKDRYTQSVPTLLCGPRMCARPILLAVPVLPPALLRSSHIHFVLAARSWLPHSRRPSVHNSPTDAGSYVGRT